MARVVFVSTMFTAPWGGSEELWARSCRILAEEGHEVFACVHGWPQMPAQVKELQAAGVEIAERRLTIAAKLNQRFVEHVCRLQGRNAPDSAEIGYGRWLRELRPNLVCIADSGVMSGLGWAKACVNLRLPFVSVGQANAIHWWPGDVLAQEARETYAKALRLFFVSQGNLELFADQVGWTPSHAEVVRNPFGVSYDAAPPWPDERSGLKLACVGRLEPPSKGQDLLLRVLAREEWRSRNITVSFFGDGDNEDSLRRLCSRLGVDGKVNFGGRVPSIEAVWKGHHALVLPSRYEGLPLAVVEAMLCGRMAIVTDVAGNAEVVTDGVDGFVAGAPVVESLASAMERAWNQRGDWRSMGAAAGVNIRRLVPREPARVFADRLLELARVADAGK